ncbi:MAG: bifunctional lysylphosphatidylglycerol flippase/synthetase MprF [Acidobacteriota bacterium]
MSERVRQLLPVAIGLALFIVALEVLRIELKVVTWHTLVSDILHTPLSRLALATVLTAINYVVLTGYDFLAFAYIQKPLSRVRIVLASFLAYAISNNIGFAMLSGASVRYRFYTRWGVTAEELSRIVFSYSVTFWLGLLGLGGLSFALTPMPRVEELPAHGLLVAVGWLLMLVPPTYVLTTAVREQPLHFKRLELKLPTVTIAIGQAAISALDWSIAGAVLYVLLPPNGVTFLQFLGIYLVAVLLGMVSHVPGGLGVFEGLMVLLLKPYLSSGQLVPALVVYRAIYYLLPLSIALIGLVADEARLRRTHAARLGALLGRLTEQLTPRILAVFTFLAGVVLLFSGATPAAPGRLELLTRIFPLGVIEASHFLGSATGAVLLILSQGLARRLDAAFYLTAITITAGMLASLLKGFDYEEATLLLAVLLILRRARPAFDRRAAFFDTRFSPTWIAALVGALVASVWLGIFAFKHVDYSNELWWRFELGGEASRFLRASVGAAVVLLLFGLARLVGYAPHEATAPSDADLQDAAKAIAAQRSTFPYLVYLRDKALLFNDDRSAFVMYGVQGRTWVALGEPVGPEDRLGDAVRIFLERCDDFGGVPVFYEIEKEYLHHYADFGLMFLKVGEEARVDLSTFGLEGSQAAKFRQALRRLDRVGGTFRVISAEGVPAVMEQLRAVSDDWLAAKAGGEKGFSLGFFDEEYLARFPVAVIEHEARIQAFANLWPGPGGTELSIDLMRYDRHAPNGVMEGLFVHLMKWGREQGYHWFILGMAPLSGFEHSPVAPLWNRLGHFLYEHGEAVYNFQGLRAYKDKFNPVWEPRYLAYPGGLQLARVLADVAALVAGGYRRIFLK